MDLPTTTVLLPEAPSNWSRRDFIKGVIASGVTVSSLSYFGTVGATPLSGQAGGVERLLSLAVNGMERIAREDMLDVGQH